MRSKLFTSCHLGAVFCCFVSLFACLLSVPLVPVSSPNCSDAQPDNCLSRSDGTLDFSDVKRHLEDHKDVVKTKVHELLCRARDTPHAELPMSCDVLQVHSRILKLTRIFHMVIDSKADNVLGSFVAL